MTKTLKIVLTIPSILGLSYFFTFWFPKETHWLVPTMKVYYLQVGILQVLTRIHEFNFEAILGTRPEGI